MKHKKLLFIVLSLCMTVCLCLGIACEQTDDGNNYQSVYSASYGEWFTLPQAEEIIVKDENGATVLIQSGKIYVDGMGEYTLIFKNGKSQTESKLKVLAGAAPAIFPSQKMAYATVGEEAKLVTAKVNDGVKELAVSGKMYLGETEVSITNGFIPEQAGEYTYVLSATGGNGRTATYEIPYYVEKETAMYEHKFTSFDKPYGVNQIGYKQGLISYSDEIAFNGESGSTRVDISGRYSSNSIELVFLDMNKADVTKYDGIYFYVYNGTSAKVTAGWSYGKYVALQPSEWTRVALDSKDYEHCLITKAPTPHGSELTLENVNGLNITLQYSLTEYVHRGESLYFSPLYGINREDAAYVQQIVDKGMSEGSLDQFTQDTFIYHYNGLTAEEQASITGYGTLMNILLKQEVERKGYTYHDNQIAYFNNQLGMGQFTKLFGAGTMRIAEDMKFNGENTMGIKLGKSAGYCDVSITLTKSYVYDLSAFDIFEFSVYNPLDVPLYLHSNDTYVGLIPTITELPANGWTTYVVRTNGKDISGRNLWIRPEWSDKVGIMAEQEFFVTPIYAYKYADRLHEMIEKGDYSNTQHLQALLEVYTKMSADVQKASAADFKTLAQNCCTLSVGDVVIPFEKENGYKYLSDGTRSIGSYVTENIPAWTGTGNAPTGVTCFEYRGDGSGYMNLLVGRSDATVFTGKETLEMWVYFEKGDGTTNIYEDFGLIYRTGGWNDTTAKNYSTYKNLQLGAWKKITFSMHDKNMLKNWLFVVGSKTGWGKLNTGDKIYFTSLKVTNLG